MNEESTPQSGVEGDGVDGNPDQDRSELIEVPPTQVDSEAVRENAQRAAEDVNDPDRPLDNLAG